MKNKILTKDKFLEFLRSREIEFSDDKYDRILNIANKLKVVDNNCITVNNEHTAIEMILGGL